jgi:glyoxylase-like metal-dependent hydrolase (beta-lactamase superfamily II)
MDKLEIPSDEVVPLTSIAPGVVGLRILIVNVFAVTEHGSWTLIDAGLNGSAGRIRKWARDHFAGTPPEAIVLTHGHFDHIGALETLIEEWDSPVYAHPDEMPYLTGERAYPPPDPSVGGGLMARMASLYPRGPIDIGGRLRALPANGLVPSLPRWRIIDTPGHSPGHVSLFRDGDRVLIAGDAFCTTKQESFLKVALQEPELHGPPAYFTTDWDAARDSVRRVADLQPAVLAPGHGRPMAGPAVTDALQQLAERFDEIARPSEGRYVEHPAR